MAASLPPTVGSTERAYLYSPPLDFCFLLPPSHTMGYVAISIAMPWLDTETARW